MGKTYTTKSGDTWDLVAFEQLGSCRYVNLLMEENADKLGAAIFTAGTVLKLPVIEENTVTTTLPPWRRKQ